ncbi:MAG: cation transporter [Sphingomonadales bacterium 32-68-7]|nr:MAG: cation transporter [Sphingomonadales bacterium 12-68-11]OYX08191.1 MAG: cation transporter [Sphingomonadales bacterium 32-68-7]
MGATHDHAHSGAPRGFGQAFAIGVALNLAFVLIEAGFGLWSGSMALVADAAHNLSDVLGLLVAWGAAVMGARPASARFTYGYKSSSILAALANAGMLLVALGVILLEATNRLFDPAPVQGWTMIAVAGVGIVVNGATAMLFARGRHSDLNIRGAFLHMAADALVSLGVVVAGAAILVTGALWIDPVTSLVIVAVIGWGTWGLLRDSVKMGLLAVPDGIDESAVRGCLAGLPGVASVHDLHIWPVSTTEAALTAHLVMPDGCPGDAFLYEAAHTLEHRFHIGHATLQVETGHAGDCVDCGPSGEVRHGH